VLYVVADNGYAISVPSSDQQSAPVADLVQGFRGLAVHRIDGTDYFEVRERAAAAIARVRASEGTGAHPRHRDPPRTPTPQLTPRASTAPPTSST
jgi:hypothetical protein